MVAIGIDLGTTFSVMAAVDATGRPRVLSNREGETTTPSVVYFDGETPTVGAAARLAATIAPRDCVELVKRHMGDPTWRFDTVAGTTYSAEQISAIILRRLVADAETGLGVPCREAVITVPAYFDDARRRATADAGVIAGLDVLRVFNEPTAAALAFGYDTHRDSTVLVYDLGGGTFDVTVVRVSGGEYEVLATAGDRNLGGFDFDNALMLYVDERVRDQGGQSSLDDELAEASLRERCEQAKRTLSVAPEAAVRVDGYTVVVRRTEFEDLSRPLLRRTEEIVAEVVEDAQLRPGELNAALLVGGSTRMPMVASMMERVTGVRADRSVHPDEAVALGAAVHAAELAFARRGVGVLPDRRRHVVRDVTAHGMGVIARSADTGREINSVVLPRNTPIPARGHRRFHTLAERQTEILIVVTEGEDTDPEYVTVVGSARVLVPPSGESVEIEVALGYDSDGMIEVSVVDVHDGRSLGEFAVDRQANVDAEEVYRMRQSLHVLDVN